LVVPEEVVMRKGWLVLMLVAAMALAAAGCGGSGETADEETPSQSPAAATSAPASPAGDAWTTVTTLRSSDPQKLEGVLISEPFDVAGTVKLTLDMPKGGKLDGVIAAIIPAEAAEDASGLLGAVTDAPTVTLIPSAPTKEVSDLEGTYVLVNSVPSEKAWSLEVKTQQ
jgi:ABC-type glycerol-3-phosphate transport system substrate-binding protein